jgi:hypothetical protein
MIEYYLSQHPGITLVKALLYGCPFARTGEVREMFEQYLRRLAMCEMTDKSLKNHTSGLMIKYNNNDMSENE